MGQRTMTAIAILLTVVFVAIALVAAFRSDTFRLTLDEVRTLYATEQSKFTDIASVSIHYQDEGSGYPIVLIHGSEGTLRTWDPIVDTFGNRYRLIRLELPSRGLSGSNGPRDIGEDVTLHGMVMALLDELGIDGTFHLIGQSSGGTIATRVAANYPDSVNKLVVLNMPSMPVDIPRSARPPAVRAYMWLCTDLLQFTTPGYWRTYYGYLWGKRERLSEDLLTLQYDQNRRIRAPLARPFIPANFSQEQADRNLGGVSAPTLVIWGMVDPVLPPNMLDALTSRMTRALLTIHKLPDTGHFPALEVPEQIIPPIEAFFSENSL